MIQLLQPVDSAVGTPFSGLLFQWESDLGDVEYVVQVATDPNFSSLVINQPLTLGVGPQYQWTAGVSLLPETTYFWRVAGNAYAEVSLLNVFVTTCAAPTISVLGSTVAGSKAIVSWVAPGASVTVYHGTETGVYGVPSAPSTTSPIVVTGVQNDQQYFIAAKAQKTIEFDYEASVAPAGLSIVGDENDEIIIDDFDNVVITD